MKRIGVLLLFYLLFPLWVFAEGYTPQQVPNVQKQNAHQYVSDPESYFASEERRQLDNALANIREQYGVEMALVVLPEVKGGDVVGFGVELFELWGLGSSEHNNGVLLIYLYDPAQRTVRMEVGYGLEGLFPDAVAYQLISSLVVPSVKEGRVAEGFLALFEEMGCIMEGTEESTWRGKPVGAEGNAITELIYFYLKLSLAIGLLYLLVEGLGLLGKKQPAKALGYMRNNGFLYGMKFFLIFFIPALLVIVVLEFFLDRWLVRRARNCPMCKAKRTVLRHKMDGAEGLTPVQASEMRVGSRSFEALHCTACGYQEVIPRRLLSNHYSSCPKCHALTYHVDSTRRLSSSLSVQTSKCEHCGHIVQRKIRHGGGGMGGFGGGSGRSFGGGFGGGRSGGGGATVRF